VAPARRRKRANFRKKNTYFLFARFGPPCAYHV
jgi:hypothetical protein